MPRSGVARALRQEDFKLGFNEAGAIMPRSGPVLVSVVASAPICFNEAGAIMPRSGRASASRPMESCSSLQ